MRSISFAAVRISHQRSSFRWVFALVFVTLLAAFITNTQGSWVYATTSGSNGVSGTVPSTPVSADCGDGTLRFGFLDSDGGPIDSINLDDTDDFIDIQICVDGLVLGGPDTVQVVIEHDDSVVELIDPACAGLLVGGFASPSTKRTSDDQASAFICSKPGGVSGSEGAVLRLTVRRTGFGTETLTFRTSGALSTQLYESGILVPVSGFDSLSVQQLNPSATPVPTAAPAPPPFIPPPATATPVPASGGSDESPVLQLEPPTEPASFVAEPGLFSIVLTWDVPEDTSGRPIDQYQIQNLKTGEIVRLGGDAFTYTFTGLDPTLQYFFTIKASTGLGTGPATGAGPVSPWGLPGPPALVTVNIEADGSSVAVSWAAPDSDGGTPVTGYSVVLTPAVLTGTALALVLETSATQILVPDLLAPGDAYSVTVSAITAAGKGPAAGGVSVSRPPELAPSPPITTPGPTATATATVAVTSGPTAVPVVDPDEPDSILITISEDEGNALEAAIEAMTGGAVEIDETVITTESAADGISISIPVNGLTRDVELTGRLDVQIGRLALDVVNGTGTAEIRLAHDITVIGVANVSAGENTLDVQITDPVLLYSPHAVDDGSFATSANSLDDVAVSFEVDLELLPDDVSLVTTYSADPDELEAAVGSTFALKADDELAYFVSVQKSGVAQGDLGDNTVTMSISLGWLNEMVSQKREIAITKVSDGGEVFTEVAQCERLSDRAVCMVTFTGEAGGFSVFAIYGFVNPDPGPAPQPLAASGSDTDPAPTATLAAVADDAGAPEPTAVVAESSQDSTPTPEIVPAPTEVGLELADVAGIGIVGADDGGDGSSVLVIVAIAAVVIVAGGSAIAVFMRRPEVPTAGLVIIAVAVGSVGLIASDSSVAQADEDPDIQQLNAELLASFDKNDFRYRKVGSEVRALSEAYRAGTLEERPDFAELSEIEAVDPSIDVTIWFASPGVVDLELIRQMATVLNHVADVVEARVPVRSAHQLSYMPGVLRVDRIVPPQVSAVTSEGTTVHGSPAWNTVGLDGTGIKVGIIDVGFLGWSSISPAELPTPTGVRCYTSVGVFTSKLSDCETGTVHGSAVAEAVDDIAPAVEFYISNPISGLDLLSTTQWMASQGVEIINYSVGGIWEGPGDGTSLFSNSKLKSVDQAVTDGILWVSAAGNEYEDTWFGNWTDSDSDGFLNFSGADETNMISVNSLTTVQAQLRWDASWQAATTDLALCLYDSGLSLVGCADEVQSGVSGQIPFEFLSIPVSSGTYYLAIFGVSGPVPNWVQLHTWSGEDLEYIGEGRSIGNPAESANSGMLAVGAAAWSSTSTIESFSSQGPTTDGRIKPDIVGADGANSASKGNWFGTSQASPHVAGLAALALQRFPSMTPADLATYLKNNAADRGTAGVDNTWGHGFAGLTAPTAPSAVADSYTVDEDAVLTVSAPSGLLSNDSDDADVFTSSLVTNASNGSVSLDPDGSFTYTPDADYNGSDSFTYKDIDPWQTSSTVSVGLTVNPLADVSGTSSTQGAPNPNNVGVNVVGTGIFSGTANISAGSNGAFTKQLAADTYAFTASADGYIARTKTSQSVTTVDMSIGSTQLRAGDADGDGDVDSADADVLLAAFVAGLPIAANRDDGLGNTVDLNADNLVDAIDISMWASNYGLQGPMAWDTVFTTPPLAIADSFWVFQDTQLSISANGVLGNDFDHEGDSLTATLVDEPSNGNLTLNSDGSFTYDPFPDYVGPDSFTYFASDAQTISVKTTVTIDVLITAPSTPTPTPGGTTGGTTVGTTVGATPTPTAVATPAATATATATVAAGTTGGAVPTATPTPTP